jgi:transcriptional regulator with XRE-family HTH domain
MTAPGLHADALGRALRHARREHDLTQLRLTVLAGVNKNVVGGIERRELDVRTSTLAKVVDALPISHVEFWALYERALHGPLRPKSTIPPAPKVEPGDSYVRGPGSAATSS